MRGPMRIVVALLFLLVSAAGAQSALQAMGDVSSFAKQANGIEIQAQRGRLRISVLSPTVIRVRYSLLDKFSERQSFAVLPGAFQGETPPFEVENSVQQLSVKTSALLVRVEKSPLRIVFQDAAGKIISQDQPGRPALFPQTAGATGFQIWKAMPEDEHYFGLGDKTGPMDHRNLALTMWNTDAFGWRESTDPLYKDIPFLLAFREGAAYGIFFDNTYRSNFDFGKQLSDAYSFSADGGELDYYFFTAPLPKK